MISEAVIKKLELRETSHTTGVSFLHKARIFFYPAASSRLVTCFLMECDPEGTPPTDNTIHIIARGPQFYKTGKVTNEMLEDLTAEKIKHVIADAVKDCKPRSHYFGRKNPIQQQQKQP